MIPHPDIPSLKLPFNLPIFNVPLEIHPFGVLVACAVLVGSSLALKRTKEMGLDEDITDGCIGYAVGWGFVGAHLYSAIFYFPERIAENPLYLLKIWDGISSFGGFVGGMMGVLYYLRKRGVRAWAYADAIIYAFAVAWIFGRLGCTVAFDHPGSLTTFPLAMPYPGDSELNAGVRHNLGFYEVFWSVIVSGLFYTQRKKKHFYGWYVAVFGILYTPYRFMLDYARQVDKRYFGFTPGQFAAAVLFGFALWVWFKRRSSGENEPAHTRLSYQKA